MYFEDLWTALRYAILPSMVFIAAIALVVWLISRFVAGNRYSGQGWLIFAFSTFGGILGFSTGNSRVGTVSALLNVTLALITLLLSYAFGKDRIGELRTTIPYCMVALLLSTFFGLSTGAVARGRSEIYNRDLEWDRLRIQKIDWEIEKAKQLQAIGQEKIEEPKEDLEEKKAAETDEE